MGLHATTLDETLRTTTATRYVTPLREGGSLPAIVEAEDDGLYVLKFRGAGQGPKALIAELVAGEIGRTLGLPVPEIVFMELDPVLGRSEPDFEIQALIKASPGLNLALDFLPGALAFDALDTTMLEPLVASSILWFDAYVTNVDRTPRNTNMLWWHRRLMLIDHGAALYFHHINANYKERSRSSFPTVKQHLLLPVASMLPEADQYLKAQLTEKVLQDIVNLIPDSWLENDSAFANPAAHRSAYLDYLLDRLAHSSVFVEEALRARNLLI
ncbi:MAG: aminotransferase class I and II [Chloroflexota bacterium]|nr:aminotransferase class I and II [Chloroflexota bacterium]